MKAVPRGALGVAGRSLPMAKDSPKTRLPPWFRVELPTGSRHERYRSTNNAVTSNSLHTVCQEAQCPNIHECWSDGTATVMIAGEVCTRGCRFCAVGTRKTPPPLNPNEPESLANAVESMQLDHAVITVVNRDDLPDGGASHYRSCLDAVRRRCPETSIEFLCSDLEGNLGALADLLEGVDIDVFAHNVECVPRMDSDVRDPRASFELSLTILREAKRLRPNIRTKTSLMVGVGETDEEISDAMRVIHESGVDILTLGQYLAPSSRHLAIDRFVTPEQFELFANDARHIGFRAVASGPLVRSSYQARELLAHALSVDENNDDSMGAHGFTEGT